MTLDELKKIEQQALDAGRERERAKVAVSSLADVRTADRIHTAYLLKKMESYGWGNEIAREAFLTVLDECQADMLRIAEMRLEALARSAGQRERMLRAQLAAYLTEPEKTEDPL